MSNEKEVMIVEERSDSPSSRARSVGSSDVNMESAGLSDEFKMYERDIHEVKSLVSLWKDEFIRRKQKRLPNIVPMEKPTGDRT